ncbi:glycosyltransferase family 2 protein [Xenorhabdus bovienii]|uniref:glycosyltransferase family 2 protein n=1 Tax=Xenorhabdus bovienii TaxID=40576 RepID=UPI0021589D0F|nr:glycosyltransferase family 2 protein [Xenorhabdus bovienii]
MKYISPKVSIITPMYNAEKYISTTIDSVISQSLQDWEMIIVDDCSSDKSCYIVEKYIESDARIRLFKFGTNSGTAAARNQAINLASGRFIAFLDSDDIWIHDKLEKQLNYMIENSIAFSYGDYFTFIDNAKNINGKFIAPKSTNINDICKTCNIGCLTVMLDRLSLSDIKIPNSPKEDYAAWITILKYNNISAYKYPGLLAGYRLSTGSLSSNKLSEIKKQYYVLKNIAKLSFIKRIYYILTYSYRGIIKYYYTYRNHHK